jgi:hypothetical protein
MKVLNVRAPKWGNEAHTIIDCTVTFAEIPGEHAFTADPTDPVEHGSTLFESLKAGSAGPIAEYVPPPKPPNPNAPTTSGVQKL